MTNIIIKAPSFIRNSLIMAKKSYNHWINNQMLFQKKNILPTFNARVGLGRRPKVDIEKKFGKCTAFTNYWPQQEI